jgi:hypothetical protein
MMLTQQGYIVALCGRGTGFKGADFKKVTQLELVRSGGSNRCCKSDW